MFSCFEALSAEFFMGQKLKMTSFVSTSNSFTDFKVTQNNSSCSSGEETAAEVKPKKKNRQPMYALEFDGLNCFETITTRNSRT
jgi:hypothetical protein